MEWHLNEETKKAVVDLLAEIEEEERLKIKQEQKEFLSRANITHQSRYDELLLKYLRLKDFLRDRYPEVWKKFKEDK